MEQDVTYPEWNLKDVAIALAVVFAGSYGLGYILLPFLNQVLSLAQRFLFTGLLQTLLFLGSVLAIIFFRYKGNLRELGLKDILSASDIKRGITGGLGLFTLVLLTGIFVSSVAPV